MRRIRKGAPFACCSKALSGVNKEIRKTQSQLTDVSRLLKLDPANYELQERCPSHKKEKS